MTISSFNFKRIRRLFKFMNLTSKEKSTFMNRRSCRALNLVHSYQKLIWQCLCKPDFNTGIPSTVWVVIQLLWSSLWLVLLFTNNWSTHLAQGYSQRSRALKSKDKKRLNEPNWYQSQNIARHACYVDIRWWLSKTYKIRIPYRGERGVGKRICHFNAIIRCT